MKRTVQLVLKSIDDESDYPPMCPGKKEEALFNT
jgi:hypothetical protein